MVRQGSTPNHFDHCEIDTLCGIDLKILNGYAGFSSVPGHEFICVTDTAPDRDRHGNGKHDRKLQIARDLGLDAPRQTHRAPPSTSLPT